MTVDEMKDDVVLERIWKEIHQRKDPGVNDDESNNNSTDVTATLSDHLKCGYTTDEASKIRELLHNDTFNVVPPPVDCPAWLCIVLPCINHLKSMKSHKNCMPEDAEVLRNGKWIRYDAASLVAGDVIQLEEGDVIPADCVVNIIVDDDCQEEYDDDLLVDLKAITGRNRPKLISLKTNNSTEEHNNNNDNNNNNTMTGPISTTRNQRTLLLGGRVVRGRAKAIVTAIGKDSVLGQLIKNGKFPVDESASSDDDGDEEESMIMDEETKNLTTMELGTMS
jgi:hypothetical protein